MSQEERGLYIGIDGGTSGLRAVVADRVGHLLERTSTAGIAPLLQDGGRESLATALDDIASRAPEGRVDGVHLALTGVDLPEDAAALAARSVASDIWPDSRVTITNDGVAAWAAATGCKPGVAVMAGTGSVVVAVDQRGDTVRAGGWGPMLGDRGGGWGIGLNAVRALLARHDAGAELVDLDVKLMAALGVRSPMEIPSRITGGSVSRSEVADLARIVIADGGVEGEAQTQLGEAAAALAIDTSRVMARLSWTDGPIAVIPTGNAFRPAYVSAFERALRSLTDQRFELGTAVLSNEGGAIMLAFKVLGDEGTQAMDALASAPALQPPTAS